jgi:hypothetical protein
LKTRRLEKKYLSVELRGYIPEVIQLINALFMGSFRGKKEMRRKKFWLFLKASERARSREKMISGT